MSDEEFLGLQLMAFSYIAAAAKTTDLEDSRHSESASDLKQCLYVTVGESRNIRNTNQKFVLLRHCDFYVLLRY